MKGISLTLCHRCKNDFEDAGKELRRNYKSKYAKEACDICYIRQGVNYIVTDKKDYIPEVPDYIKQHYPHLIKNG